LKTAASKLPTNAKVAHRIFKVAKIYFLCFKVAHRSFKVAKIKPKTTGAELTITVAKLPAILRWCNVNQLHTMEDGLIPPWWDLPRELTLVPCKETLKSNGTTLELAPEQI
jgi:hypothetical protein